MRSLPSHSGKAKSSKGGTTSDMIRCWSMCAEYRYSSEMSCIGQSEANHKNAIAATNAYLCLRVMTGSLPFTAFGPTTLVAYKASSTELMTMTQTSG